MRLDIIIGEGGRDPLPLTGSLRRPLSGVLNRFALKSLPFRTPTGMSNVSSLSPSIIMYTIFLDMSRLKGLSLFDSL